MVITLKAAVRLEYSSLFIIINTNCLNKAIVLFLIYRENGLQLGYLTVHDIEKWIKKIKNFVLKY
jgi:hypothetical protein